MRAPAPLRIDAPVEKTAGDDVEDEFAQQRRRVHHAAVVGHGRRETRPQVERSHPHLAGHADGVLDAGGRRCRAKG